MQYGKHLQSKFHQTTPRHIQGESTHASVSGDTLKSHTLQHI
jgi:hypothetical protein